jgi:hypothetical protein
MTFSLEEMDIFLTKISKSIASSAVFLKCWMKHRLDYVKRGNQTKANKRRVEAM